MNTLTTTATKDMTGLAWAALVTRWEPEGEPQEGQEGPVMVYRLDEPTLEILTHDLEAERWEDVDEYLGLALEEMFEHAEREETEREVLAALASLDEEELPRLRKTLTTPTVFDKEATIEATQLTIPEPTEPMTEAFVRYGAEFEPNREGRYAVAKCQKCKHRASGMLHAVLDAMEEHEATHTRKPVAAKAPRQPVKEKPRCATHGVWAREDDGRCKRCDEPSVDPEADAVMAALREAIAAALAANPQVTQRVDTSGPAKLVLGVRGNGLLARRSAHALAEATGLPQRDLAKLTAEEARALVLERKIDADWVPANQL